MQAELQSLAQRFADKPAKTLPTGHAVWIFGAGQFGRDLCTALQRAGHTVAGFIETKPSATQVLGLPLFNWQQWSPVYSAAPLCIGIFNRSMPLDELETLARQNGAHDVYLPWDLYHAFKQDLGWRFWLSEPKRILSQLVALAKAMDCLSDDISKRCLLDIAAFRLGLNTSYGSFHHTENQYFNSLTLDALQGKPIRFVDGGAYNDDTYLELCSLADVQEGYLFEPDASNFAALVSNTGRTQHTAHSTQHTLFTLGSIRSLQHSELQRWQWRGRLDYRKRRRPHCGGCTGHGTGRAHGGFHQTRCGRRGVASLARCKAADTALTPGAGALALSLPTGPVGASADFGNAV